MIVDGQIMCTELGVSVTVRLGGCRLSVSGYDPWIDGKLLVEARQ